MAVGTAVATAAASATAAAAAATAAALAETAAGFATTAAAAATVAGFGDRRDDRRGGRPGDRDGDRRGGGGGGRPGSARPREVGGYVAAVKESFGFIEPVNAADLPAQLYFNFGAVLRRDELRVGDEVHFEVDSRRRPQLGGARPAAQARHAAAAAARQGRRRARAEPPGLRRADQLRGVRGGGA